MRHLKKTVKLGLSAGPRRALLRGLATNFVLAGKIKTTLPKAKIIKPIVEKYITMSKKNDLSARRNLLKYFYDEKAVSKLLTEIGPKYAERKGGYTRIIKLMSRKGDNAPMAILELV